MKNIRRFTSLSDFYLGDLHEDNFIIDIKKRELYVNDVDSVKIAGNLSFSARYLALKHFLIVLVKNIILMKIIML